MTNRSQIATEAWVLSQARPGEHGPGTLERETFCFDAITDDEALVEPLYGCWEGNMAHAVERSPIDICAHRGEPRVVIGNAGVVRILKTGANVRDFREGDVCMMFTGEPRWNAFGYQMRMHAYDALGSVGMLAKRSKLHARQLVRIPEPGGPTLAQWAAFSLRYVTAWANFRVAHGAYRLMVEEQLCPHPYAWGWGGGVTLAELELARHHGYHAAMLSSDPERLELIRSKGITAVDRREFPDLEFDELRYRDDAAYRRAYCESEARFLETVRSHTEGRGASIFIDLIGAPVLRATLKALAWPGVLATAGWKEGMKTTAIRALECMNWHTHVHTHYGRYDDAVQAVRFALEHDWLPSVTDPVWRWDEIPALVEAYVKNQTGYFPVFQINPE